MIEFFFGALSKISTLLLVIRTHRLLLLPLRYAVPVSC
jgi:hypothetical protein